MKYFYPLLASSLLLVLYGCDNPEADLPERKVFVLGVDGMDYAMTTQLIAEGRMPNFSRLAKQGVFQPLQTSVPPLSPVAWSDFITGMDPGGHGIFDFLHRDPKHIVPKFAMSQAQQPSQFVSLGSWRIPLDSGQVFNLRQGEVFWRKLTEMEVSSSIIRIPANYPPVGEAQLELSGMGTPDIRGSYGIFTFISTKFGAGMRSVDGGEIQEVWEKDGVVNAVVKGPPNPFKEPAKDTTLELPLQIRRDEQQNAAILYVSGQTVRLKQGDWSDWVPVEFEMLPILPFGPGILHGMVRFYVRSVFPDLELYVSPVNFDPTNPDTQISSPMSFAAELAESTGRFYTQGMPEETKALEEGVLTQEEFMQQARLSAQDILAQLETLVMSFNQERRAFMFYYLGHLDQISHMTWKSTDPQHPAYDPETDPKLAAKLEELYIDIDSLVGRLVSQLGDETSLVVMSDHGFAPWRREMDLNGWLRDKGYLALKAGRQQGRKLYADVDWSRTRAYGLGFNGLYLNLQGREKEGIVPVTEREELLKEIRRELLATIDPGTDQAPISKVYQSDEYFQDQGAMDNAPDLIVGYAFGTRVSSNSALGAVADSKNVFIDHLGAWSGDHSMDHAAVPGILLSNHGLKHPVNNLRDLSKALVKEFEFGEAMLAVNGTPYVHPSVNLTTANPLRCSCSNHKALPMMSFATKVQKAIALTKIMN